MFFLSLVTYGRLNTALQVSWFWNLALIPVQVSVSAGVGRYRYRPSKKYEYRYRPLFLNGASLEFNFIKFSFSSDWKYVRRDN